MTDDLDTRLRGGLAGLQLPAAPDAVHEYLAGLGEQPDPIRRRGRLRPWLVLAAAAAVLLVATALAVGSTSPPPPHVPPSTSATVPTASQTPDPSSVESFPASVDGLTVQTVSELLAARAAGGAKGGPYVLRGYWTDRSTMRPCHLPVGQQPGELELLCNDGDWGITELDEPILDVQIRIQANEGSTSRLPPKGPHLTPYIPSDSDQRRLFAQNLVARAFWPPVPIVVVGRFDDPKAADCRVEARQLCLDRFVIDRIVDYDPTSVPAPTPSPGAIASPAASERGFQAPGFAFDPPSGWSDQTDAVAPPGLPEVRVVGYLVRGMTSCPVGYGSPPPTPAGCEQEPTRTGTATLTIAEWTHQYPWVLATLGQSTIAGYLGSSSQGDTAADWVIVSPGGGFYRLVLNSPKDELDANAAAVTRALDSLELTSWEPPPTIVNGLIHEDPGQGFSFDYPATWSRWYQQDRSTMDSGVVTVASGTLAPCKTDSQEPVSSGSPAASSCQNYMVPPGTVAIEFRIGRGPHPPDWTAATTTLGGQPAFKEDWGPANAHGADEGHTWNVRLNDSGELGVNTSLRGPDLPGLRSAMNDLLASLRIGQVPSPAP